jgi:hypothetical protein
MTASELILHLSRELLDNEGGEAPQVTIQAGGEEYRLDGPCFCAWLTDGVSGCGKVAGDCRCARLGGSALAFKVGKARFFAVGR